MADIKCDAGALPPFDPDKLILALNKSQIHYFRYFPQKRLVIVPERTYTTWGGKPVYYDPPRDVIEMHVDKADEEAAFAMYQAIDDGADTAGCTFRIKGEDAWCRITLITVSRDADGKPLETMAIIENLTNTKERELLDEERYEELNAMMQIFGAATEINDSIIFVFDAENESIIVPDNTADQWGVSTVQPGVPYETAHNGTVLPESIDEYIRIHEEIMHGASRSRGKVWLRDASDNVSYYELNMRALVDENGQPTGRAVGVYQDITEFEEDFVHQAKLTRALAEGITSAYYVDLDKDIVHIEQVSRGLSGDRRDFVDRIHDGGSYSRQMQAYIDIFVREENRKFILFETSIPRIMERLKMQHSYYLQYRVNDAPVDKGYNEIHIVDADDPDGGNKIFISFRNIDDQMNAEIAQKKALEEAFEASAQANHAKTTFLSRMSHDIRTPMNAIIGMTGIAKAHIDDKERVEDCLEKIDVSSQHLLALINEVLDMSKIEAGKLDLNVSEFNITDLIDTLIAMSKQNIEEKGQTFTVDVHGITHEHVAGDVNRIQQVFTNLMSNAIKYTPEGGSIKLTIVEKPTQKMHTGCYEFIFEDTGIGMSPEFIERIFEPFSRADDKRAAMQQGTGLGMAIALNIVHLMNGDIKVESELGKGTKVTVTIFLEIVSEKISDYSSKAAAVSGGDTALRQSFPGMRALLVEDNLLNAEIAKEVLKLMEFEIDHVTDGSEALEVMRTCVDGTYDIVFMDIQMPVMNGYETTRAIRALGRDYTSNIPIIAMTANAFAEDVQAAHEAGMNEHVAKPIDCNRLLTVVNEQLPE